MSWTFEQIDGPYGGVTEGPHGMEMGCYLPILTQRKFSALTLLLVYQAFIEKELIGLMA